jgi:outer membrane protein OmpA-like peptidoglycan-associated protein
VNSFYKKIVDAVKSQDRSAEKLARIVGSNRPLAQTCLAVLDKKARQPGKEGEACEFLCSRLQESLWLTSPKSDCSSEAVTKVLSAAEKLVDDSDREYYLDRIIALCPQTAQAYYLRGDLYLKNRQTGMAIDAYKKGLALKDDDDSRTLLEKAQALYESYKKGGPVTVAQVEKLFKSRTMAPVEHLTVRKISIATAIQTNRIHFDEWSSTIRKESEPELQAVGKVAQVKLNGNRNERLLVEGHTDRRGPAEKNEKLSRERAESVKQYLVKNFGIDPSRLVTNGYGPRRPFAASDDPQGWALNRRVEFKKIEEVEN